MGKRYSVNVKKMALQRFKKGENVRKIANELNIVSGSQLIYIWEKNEKFCYSKSIDKCKAMNEMSKKITKEYMTTELKTNLKEIKELKKKNALLQKQHENDLIEKLLIQGEIEVLKKSLLSCAATMIINLMRMVRMIN
ncbi:hypothetical protein [Spiroplasma endosymbiont of Aspidapion aeneum]|uniref:hypothetical protein n=1 Tax=Spiroplasma endosymbiont of Aspidapion aeneum TaxID=3066276 RepID=UPI00313A7BA6